MGQEDKDVALACVLLAFASGKDESCDAAILRQRESDAIVTILEMSGATGAEIESQWNRLDICMERILKASDNQLRSLSFSKLRFHSAMMSITQQRAMIMLP